MPTRSGNIGGALGEGGSADDGNSRLGDGYVLPRQIRTLCRYIAVLVAYSQFTGIGLLSFFRYHDAWDYGRYYKSDGYLNENFLVLSLFLPGGEIAHNEPHMVVSTLALAMLIVPHGCAGLLVAAYARQSWRYHKPIILGSLLIGLATAAFVLGLQAFVIGARGFNMNIDDPYEYFAMHGVLEAVGGTVVPAAAYLALLLWLSHRWLSSWLSSHRG